MIEVKGYSIPIEASDGIERDICIHILNNINGFDISQFKIEQRTDKYTSLCYGLNDFFRVKIGERSMWFSVDSNNIKDQADNKIFIYKNKNERHWKVKLNSVDEIYKYTDLICNCCYVLR